MIGIVFVRTNAVNGSPCTESKNNRTHYCSYETRIVPSPRVGKQRRVCGIRTWDYQGCHMAKLGPTKWPCPSNLTPSSLSIRSFQSQWDTTDRFLEPGLCFSPQNPPIVLFEAMILWHGMNGAKGLFARAVPTKPCKHPVNNGDLFGVMSSTYRSAVSLHRGCRRSPYTS